MRTSKNRLAIVLATTIGFAALVGCQQPIGVQVPRVVVVANKFQVGTDADLSISLDFRPLLKSRYGLQATESSYSHGIERFVAKVTGENIPDPKGVSAEVLAIDCPSGIATINFAKLPPGPVHVTVGAIALNGHDIPVWGGGDVTIVPGITVDVPVLCSSETGGLNVVFTCPGLCGAEPSPTPSPTPKPPVNPTALTEWVQTFGVDSLGNVYLAGLDKPFDPTQYIGSDPPNRGRIVRVFNDVSLDTNVLYDDVQGCHDIERDNTGRLYVGSAWLSGVTWPNGIAYGKLGAAILDVSGPAATRVDYRTLYPNFEYDRINDFALKSDGVMIGAGIRQGFQSIVSLVNQIPVYPGEWYTGGQDSVHVESLARTSGDRPIWTSAQGICTVVSNTIVETQLTPLVPNALMPNSAAPQAFASIERTGTSDKFLVSFVGSHEIHLWDRLNPGAFPIVTQQGESAYQGYPHKIKIGADGRVYVMAMQNSLADLPEENQEYKQNYRVVRGRLINGSLVFDQVMVDTFQ